MYQLKPSSFLPSCQHCDNQPYHNEKVKSKATQKTPKSPSLVQNNKNTLNYYIKPRCSVSIPMKTKTHRRTRSHTKAKVRDPYSSCFICLQLGRVNNKGYIDDNKQNCFSWWTTIQPAYSSHPFYLMCSSHRVFITFHHTNPHCYLTVCYHAHKTINEGHSA